MAKKDKNKIIGVHENTDWFRYMPNEPSRAEGCQVQAKWVNGSRILRHRRKGGGAWIDGAPWDK